VGMQYADTIGGSELTHLRHIALEGHGVFKNMGGPFTSVNAAHAGRIGP